MPRAAASAAAAAGLQFRNSRGTQGGLALADCSSYCQVWADGRNWSDSNTQHKKSDGDGRYAGCRGEQIAVTRP